MINVFQRIYFYIYIEPNIVNEWLLYLMIKLFMLQILNLIFIKVLLSSC